MSKYTRRAPRFHILCPDKQIIDDFRHSNRLLLALEWHTPHKTTFGKQLEQQDIDRLSGNDYIFCIFPVTKSERILERYNELGSRCKDMGVNCYIFTFHFHAFDSYESMLNSLIFLIVQQLELIYNPVEPPNPPPLKVSAEYLQYLDLLQKSSLVTLDRLVVIDDHEN